MLCTSKATLPGIIRELHSGNRWQQLHSSSFSSFSSPGYTRRVPSALLACYDLIISSLIILMILHLRVSAGKCLYSRGPNAFQRCDLGEKLPAGSATTALGVVNLHGTWGDLSICCLPGALLQSCCPAPQSPSFTHVWVHPHQEQACALVCIETHNAPVGLTRGPFSTQQINVTKVFIAYSLKLDQGFFGV